MNVSEFVVILLALVFADAVIRYLVIFRVFYPIKNRLMDRERLATLPDTGKGSVHIALLGDSVVYGQNADYPIPAVKYIAQDLVKRYKTVIVKNYAVSGDRINQLIDTQLPKIVLRDLAFIYIGANDYFRFTSTRKFSHSVDRLLEKLEGKTVIWCTLADPRYLHLLPIWQRYAYRSYAVAYMKYVESAIKQHSREYWYTIDFMHEPAKRLRERRVNSHSLIADGFHLNDAGHELWAPIVKDAYYELQGRGAKLP
jgi:lysophospholipase L1-like esterase